MVYAIVYFFLLNAKTFVGAITLLKFLPNLVLLIGVIKYLMPKRGSLYFRRPSEQSKTYVWVIFLILWGLSIIRTSRPGWSPIGHVNDLSSIFLLSLVIFQYISSRFRTPQVFDQVFTRETLKLLILPSSVIWLLFLAYIFGYNKASTVVLRMGEEMVILKALGINLVKKAIPFTGAATHPNMYGIWAGATFILNAIAILVLKVDRRTKWILYVNGMVIFGFLLFADSRGTLLSTILTAALVYFTYKFRFAGALRVIVIVVPFLPFLFVALMGILSQTVLAEKLSRRGGAQNLSTLSARTVIWEECLVEIRDLKPIHLIGYGEHGQAAAGVSLRYAHIFPDDWDQDESLIVTHNFFFQAFFDIGYLGVFFVILAIYLAMDHAIYLYNKGYRAGLIYIGFLVYYVLSGALESTFGNHFRQYSVVFIAVMSTIYAFRSEFDRMAAQEMD